MVQAIEHSIPRMTDMNEDLLLSYVKELRVDPTDIKDKQHQLSKEYIVRKLVYNSKLTKYLVWLMLMAFGLFFCQFYLSSSSSVVNFNSGGKHLYYTIHWCLKLLILRYVSFHDFGSYWKALIVSRPKFNVDYHF